MRKITWDEGKKFVQEHACGVVGCGRPLVLAWDGSSYVVKCNTHPESDEYTVIKSAAKAWKQGEPVTPYEAQAIEKRVDQELRKGEVVVHRGVIMDAKQKDGGSRKELTVEQIRDLIDYALTYGLDPRRNHVCMMYGRPFIEIDGLFFKANEKGELDGYGSRPLTLNEKAEAGYDPDDVACIVWVYRKGRAQRFEGRHRVTRAWLDTRTADGGYRYPTWREWTERMVEKQATRFALRVAFPDWELWGKEDAEISGPGSGETGQA